MSAKTFPVEHVQGTRKSERVYNYLRRYLEKKGYPPTMRETAAGLKMPLATVKFYMSKLQKDGWISMPRYRARAIRLLRKEA